MWTVAGRIEVKYWLLMLFYKINKIIGKSQKALSTATSQNEQIWICLK